MKAAAFSPCHVTGFFSIAADLQGSIGAGFCIERGVKTTVRAEPAKANRLEIALNGQTNRLPTSHTVVRRFMELVKAPHALSIAHKAELPVGYGFGTSGAGALSLALALNKAMRMRLSALECALIAHEAEIECGTGLGTVIAERFGGFGVRTEPANFEKYGHVKYPKSMGVVLAPMRPIDTSKIIRDAGWQARIGGIGTACVRDLLANPTSGQFTSLSRLFATESGLAHGAVLEAMNASGGSMAMLGESVFVLTDKPKAAASVLRSYCKNVIVTKISSKGAGLLK